MRRRRGASGSDDPLFEEDDDAAEDEDGRGRAMVAESPGLISAWGPPSLAPETARRRRGGPSLPLSEELEPLDELPAVLLSELDEARRRRGRSGSSSPVEPEELPDEELSELDEARRRLGLPEDDEEEEESSSEELEELDERRNVGLFEDPDELLLDADEEPLSGRGRGLVSSV